MSVSQAAYRIGYISLGHFSKAFQRRFGISPKHYLLEHRDRNATLKITKLN